jgi:peptidoglycan biosynthesis protein MviN/MurJ (putative lipid II flippase)
MGRPLRAISLAQIVAWGSVAGSALQVAVQLPSYCICCRVSPHADYKAENVKTVVRNFIPVFVGRGVVRSALCGYTAGSWLPMGAVAGPPYAQILYLLPVSLFRCRFRPQNSAHVRRAGSEEEVAAVLRRRLNSTSVRSPCSWFRQSPLS